MNPRVQTAGEMTISLPSRDQLEPSGDASGARPRLLSGIVEQPRRLEARSPEGRAIAEIHVGGTLATLYIAPESRLTRSELLRLAGALAVAAESLS